ncbi:MAG: hypothetical protein CMK59_14870 [Proteobacteria bacterium]|nr:hypothetical protein [Pseudomonadota bacterium]
MNLKYITCASAALLASGCSSLKSMPEAATNYSEVVYASYADSLTAATDLDSAIQSFLTAPDASGLSAAQTAWLDSREPYLQTEVYRFYEGPIDNEEDGPEGLINAWPMDESYVDYTMGQMGLDNSGIVNDSSVTIDAATLESLNEQGGEENIATGFHAIEFLLWGQDLSADGPGNRAYTDYVDRGDAGSFGCYDMTTHAVDCEATTEAECTGGAMWAENVCATNSDRRGEYLTVASEMLVGHLTGLQDAWAPDAENYRADFEALSEEEQLTKILTGMIILSGFETGGERLQTALDSGDQEDEHSCFSDNTHRDMVQDVQGVQNVYLGTYGSISGTSIKDIVEAQDADLAARLETEIQTSLDLANELQPPFDQEIASDNAEGRARVQALIDALRVQEATLEEVFLAFELTVPVAE